jgi:hypothetical protein
VLDGDDAGLDLLEGLGGGVGADGGRADEEVEDGGAESVDVGALVERLAAELLRRHVGEGSHDGAGDAEAGDARHGAADEGVVVRGGVGGGDEAEVGDVGDAVAIEEDVGGLEVAVDDAESGGLDECLGDAEEVGRDVVPGSGPWRSTASWREPPSTSCMAMNQTPRSSPTK